MSSWAWKIVLFLLACAGVYLIGNGTTQLFDRDEPRYAQCSRQMLQSGDWVVPRLYDQIRAAKPPGIYWCQATFMKLMGDTSLAARMPSVLASLLTSILLAIAVRREAGPRRAAWTVFIFATSALVIVSAKVCLTDSVLLLFTTIALASVYLLWQGRGGWPAVIALAAAIGCGGIVKGPFILGVLAGTIAMLWLLTRLDRYLQRRRARQQRSGFDAILDEAGPVPGGNGATAVAVARAPTRIEARRSPVAGVLKTVAGAAIVAMIVLPWIILVQHRSPGFLTASSQDALEHLKDGAEGHSAPPGYHLALIWGTFLPWSVLLPLAIGLGFKNRLQPQVRFALAATLGSWIFCEVLQTKLPHYMLCAFPSLAFLTGDAVVRCLDGEQRDLESAQMRIGAVIWATVVAGLGLLPWWLALHFHDLPWAIMAVMSAFVVLYGTGVCWMFFARRPRAALISMGGGALVFAALAFGLFFPRARPFRGSIEVARVLRAHEVVHPHEVLMLDYKEPSLAFYQGGTIREAKHWRPVMSNLDAAPPWLVMTRQVWEGAPQSARDRLEIVASFNDFDYSDSFRMPVLIVARKK